MEKTLSDQQHSETEMDSLFSEALYCKQVMVGNRQMMGLSVPCSEEINRLLRDIHKMTAFLKDEYGIRLTLEDTLITRPPITERRACRRGDGGCIQAQVI